MNDFTDEEIEKMVDFFEGADIFNTDKIAHAIFKLMARGTYEMVLELKDRKGIRILLKEADERY